MAPGVAGIYTRISLDRVGAGLGVERQLNDCRPLCVRRGYSPDQVRVYSDNDISASDRRKPRPDYQRLLADIRRGELTFLAAWHNDRLHRLPSELEEFIDIVETAGLTDIEMVRAGGFDLSTASGRMVARMLGAAARYQVEHMIEQVRAKHDQLARSGKSAGGGRPFGYGADRRRLRPPYSYCRLSDRAEITVDEPELIREAARRILRGESLGAVCSDWTARGIPTVGRAPIWQPKVLRQILIGARISGRRGRSMVDGRRQGIDRIVPGVIAEWPAIISVADSDRLRAKYAGSGQAGRPRRELLSGIARCGLCGAKLRGRASPDRAPMLVCPSRPDGCARIRVQAELATAAVETALWRAIDLGALDGVRRRAGEESDQAALDELAGLQLQQADLARRWARRAINDVEWDAAKSDLDAQERALRRRLEDRDRRIGLAALPDHSPEGWAAAPVAAKRSFLSLFIESVIVHPGRRGRFTPDRIDIRWRA